MSQATLQGKQAHLDKLGLYHPLHGLLLQGVETRCQDPEVQPIRKLPCKPVATLFAPHFPAVRVDTAGAVCEVVLGLPSLILQCKQGRQLIIASAH